MCLVRTIAFRLFLLIGAVTTLALTVLTILSIENQRNDLMSHVELDGARFSDLVIRSTRHSMLENRKEEVKNIISAIGGEQGIEGIRIYNKDGEVVFSTTESEIHQKADLSAEACIACHPSESLDEVRPPGEGRYRIFGTHSGERVLGLITPIMNESSCSDAACHAHPADKTILGILDLQMSLVTIDSELQASANRHILFSIGAVALSSLVSGIFIWIVIHRPVHSLITGMKDVGSGRLSRKIFLRQRSEIGELADQFNVMTSELFTAREELTGWSRTLEEKVREKTNELEAIHRQMLHVEKMASLGNLAASVAHELNNPLEGILTFAKLLIKRIRKLSLPAETEQEITSDLSLVADETRRCGTIVKDLLLFARRDHAVSGPVQLREVIDRCISLIGHHARVHNVSISVDCPPEAVIEGSRHEMEQVFIALSVNAIEAMSRIGGNDEGGSLRITAEVSHDSKSVLVHVSDTGIGMTDEVKRHVFEPFFTTKSGGTGVGLGLAIVYGIIRRHRGTISIESTSPSGTSIFIRLPSPQACPEDHGTESLTEGNNR
ncbi:MAG: ATP-binding protein [Ignavibacteria bacterium]|nr:ATP-binding protein [Ignavibacteria bacterium]